METYRLKSRLIGSESEYIIQTANDTDLSAVSSTVIVNGVATETVRSEHPADIDSEEVLSLVKRYHAQLKEEIESLLNLFQQAVDSGDAEVMADLGVAFYYKKLYSEARQLLRGATRYDTKCHRAWNYWALTELALGDGEAAIQAGQEAVRQRPAFADYRNNLGMAYLHCEFCAAAVEQLQKAVEINLYYADAYFNLGLALILNAIKREDRALFENVLERAEQQFQRALVAAPDYDTLEFQQGLAALRNSRLTEAYELLRGVQGERIERHRREYAGYYLRSVLEPSSDTDQVLRERIAFLQEQLARNPNYIDLVMQLGHCYLQQARWACDQALGQYREALQKNPGLTQARRCLDEAEHLLPLLNEALESTAIRK